MARRRRPVERIDLASWKHEEAGLYRRRDGKGVINLVGPNDWSAIALKGPRGWGTGKFPDDLVSVGNAHTAFMASDWVDRACPPNNVADEEDD